MYIDMFDTFVGEKIDFYQEMFFHYESNGDLGIRLQIGSWLSFLTRLLQAQMYNSHDSLFI